jgi:hypothetical protein
VPHGFIDDHGVFSTIDVPHAPFTEVQSNNASGQLVGFYGDSNDGSLHGFLATPKNDKH